MKILSFDIGGSKISSALVDEHGKLLTDVKKVATPQNCEDISEYFRKCVAETVFDRAAIATAGVVKDNKLTGKPNNLPVGYENIDFAAIFKTEYVMENDANAAVWAEFKLGNLLNVQHGVMLTLGTDVGCGIICNGTLLHGKSGAAGEVQMNFSGRSLLKLAEKYKYPETDCFKIYERVKSGDATAKKIYYEWEENLISGLLSINRLLDTEVFALSGSLAKIADYAKINTSIKLLLPTSAPEIKPARLGVDAGLIGAALLLSDKIRNNNKRV